MKRAHFIGAILAVASSGAMGGLRRQIGQSEKIPAPPKVLRKMMRQGKKKPACFGSRAGGYRG